MLPKLESLSWSGNSAHDAVEFHVGSLAHLRSLDVSDCDARQVIAAVGPGSDLRRLVDLGLTHRR